MASPNRTERSQPFRASRGASPGFAIAKSTAGLVITALGALVDDLISDSTRSERVMAEHARTFRFASRFLPRRYRDQTISLYAFFRTLDDLVDETELDDTNIAAIQEELDGWDDWFRHGFRGIAPRRELAALLAPICTEHSIPSTIFVDFLNGLRTDLNPRQPENRAQLEHYSYQVASTVGLSMAHVFGAVNHSALVAATQLGIAMQLTNILRDIGGDLNRGRVYLPVSLLEDHSLSRVELFEIWSSGGGPDERLRSSVRMVIGWADEHYQAGIDGISMLPRDVRLPILISARLYWQILRELERNDFDSLRRRAATNGLQKVHECLRSAVSSEIQDPGVGAFITSDPDSVDPYVTYEPGKHAG